MNIVYFRLGLWLFFSCISCSVAAICCQHPKTPVEYSICNNNDLRWLDDILRDIYWKNRVNKDRKKVDQQWLDWLERRNGCTDDKCIEQVYYHGIALFSDIDLQFNWAGSWWNLTATNGSGGNILINDVKNGSAHLDSKIWSGVNRGDYQAEICKKIGLGIVNNIADTSNCKLLLIPLKTAAIKVHSNGSKECQISMPKDVFIDGCYIRADKDPRPEATLLSIGIFTEAYLEKAFKELVGDHYSRFIKTANVYVYRDDLDNFGAKVISLWMRGMANKQAAIIMYTPNGKIWAAHVEPDHLGQPVMGYWSNVSPDSDKMPKTLKMWQRDLMD